MSECILVPQYIRSYLKLKCLKKPIPILNQPRQCCIIILPYFVAKKGGKEIKKFALLSSFLVSWSLTSVYIGENLFRIMDTLGWNHFCENILISIPHCNIYLILVQIVFRIQTNLVKPQRKLTKMLFQD